MMHNVDELLPWYWLRDTPGIGPSRIRLLLDHLGKPADVLQCSVKDYEGVPSIGKKLANALDQTKGDLDSIRRQVQTDVEAAEKVGAEILTLVDPEYPQRLKDQPNVGPPLLYVQGSLESLNPNHAIAIVGTRKPSASASEAARQLAADLAGGGWAIVSGLAQGIDTQAHRGALACGGLTLAVVGSGLDQIYPRVNVGLAGLIQQRGAILSQYPMGTRTAGDLLRRRNSLIVALSEAVIAVEFPHGSGTEIAVDKALEQGKPVFCLRHEGAKPSSALGSAKLLETHIAAPLTVHSTAKDIAGELAQFSGTSLAILFDLDGVLVDTRRLEQEALRSAVERIDGERPSDEAIGPVLGISARKALRTLSNSPMTDLLDAYQEAWSRLCRKKVREAPKAASILAELRSQSHKLAVVTSRNRAQVKMLLDVTGLIDFFPGVVTWGDTASHKPSPEPLRTALSKVGKYAGAVYIGDSPEDLLAADAGGISFIGAGWFLDDGGRGRLEAAGALDVLRSASELISSIDRLKRRAWIGRKGVRATP